MSCPRCGRANRAGARFCGGCGASLTPHCAACGAANVPDARFCDACGAALDASGAAGGAAVPESITRKVVTIVFADLIGSTALHERLDPESVSRVMEAYHASVRVPIEAHGGTVVQLLGDGVMCAFGVPRVAEDDALRAVRAAVAVQESFRAFLAARPELAGKVGLRVAVNTGEVVVSDDYAAGIGDPLNVAARLQQEARDGDVLIGEATQRHVREQVTLAPVGSFALKGRAEPVTAWRVVSLERPAGAAAVPFVGREEELRRLQTVFDAASSAAAPAARLVVLLGSPGLGKSRLVAEWVGRLEGRATLLSARCESGRGATFAPLAAALRERLGAHGDPAARIEALLPADEPERARIAAGMGALLAGQPALPQETFFVVRRFLAALAQAQPVVLLIDDLHWAEPLLLDLVEHLVQWGAGVPLLVLAAARPELRALRSSLATPGPLASDVLTLAGLDAVAATQLAARVIGADALPAAIAGRVLATSEGNPLFLAELVRMLVDDGVLRREGEQWVAAGASADFPMPPSIQALLAARIERLAPDERSLLERAAVVGRRFSRSALLALLPREADDLDARLEALRRSELIEPDPGWLLGEPALRFHHALIRDAAYRRVLKNTRAELHARIAGWIEERAGGAVEHDETIGWHFEQAHQNLRELGPLDERGREFGARAARHLGAAGQRALARDDLPLAAGLLGRALERLAPESPARIELLLDHCEALLATGEVAAARQAVGELARLAGGSERLRAWHTCFAGQLAALTDPDALRATAEAAAAAAGTLAAAGDAVGEAKAHAVHAGALARLGAIGGCEAALDRALAAARRADDRRRANAVLAGAPLAALFGPSPVTRASGRCLDVVRVLRITQGAPAVEAVALRCQAVLEALRGRLDAARRMVAASRRLVEELGVEQQLLESDVFTGWIEWLAGDAVAAERWLRDAYTGMRQRGLRIDAARAAAQLGRTLLAQGRAGEAEALSHESEALAGDDLQAAIAWRGVRAEALAQRGEKVAAVALARGAVEIASATDALLHHADAHLALAAVLRAGGSAAQAEAEEARAVALWEEKGATLLAERSRRERRPVAPEQTPDTAPLPLRAGRRRVRPNTATHALDRIRAAIAARDGAALPALAGDDLEVVHEPTRSVTGREETLRVWRALIEMPDGALTAEPLATLGESLALCRHRVSAAGAAGPRFDVGGYEVENLVLAEVDAQGRQRRGEFFDADRLGEAIARLYQRHAERLPEGRERERAAAVARSVASWLSFAVRDGAAAVVAPDVEFLDHRPVGFGRIRGAEAIRLGSQAQHELARDVTFRIHDVLALEPNAFLLRSTTSGVDREGGGAYERPLLLLGCFGTDGLVTRIEWFDPDRPELALARFEALASGPVRRRVRPNEATANAEVLTAAIAGGDAPSLAALHGDGVQVVHHATGVTLDREATLSWWAESFGDASLGFRLEPLATLGASAGLFRQVWSGSASNDGAFDLGAYERDALSVMRVADGRAERIEVFPPDELAEAVARFYALHAESLPESPERTRAEAISRTLEAFGTRDADRICATIAPGCEYVDHRSLGFPPLRGAEPVRGFVRSLLDVADDVAFGWKDVLDLRPDALLVAMSNKGTDRASGGAFERKLLQIRAYDAEGRVTRWEQFDVGDVERALARFDELAPESPTARIENAAARAQAAFERAWRERRWDDVVASFAPAAELDDRRRLVGVRVSSGDFLPNVRLLFEMPASGWRTELLATRGERLALFRTLFSADIGEGASIVDEHLSLVEHEADGRIRAIVTLDLERRDAAHAELDRRYFAREAAAHPSTARTMQAFLAAFGRRDWEALGARFAADVDVRDHRRLGWEPLRGRDAYLASLRSLVELAPDARLRLDHARLSERGVLWVASWVGTREGGSFETPWIIVSEHDAEGVVRRFDQYDVDRLDTALARFEALRPNPLRIPANAAARLSERLHATFAQNDATSFEALIAPAFRYDDRRRGVRTSGDRERFLASARLIRSAHSRALGTLLATAGERLALERRLWRSETLGTEVDSLDVVEIDAEGRLLASVTFDPDERRAAASEMFERYFRGEGASATPPSVVAVVRAMNAHDAAGVRAALPEGFVFQDLRRTGVGRLGNVDDYVASLEAIWAQSRDASTDTLYHVAVAPHAALSVGRMFGTLDGGGEFETIFLRLSVYGDGTCVRTELYELDDLERARASFEALRPDPLRIPPNAAERASDTLRECVVREDWAALRAFAAPGFRFDDRRRLALVSGGIDLYLQNLRVVRAYPELRPTRELLASAGDRVAVSRLAYSGGAREGVFEGEFLILAEVDAEGRLLAIVHFDADDRGAAFEEAQARFAAGEAAAHPGQAAIARMIRAFSRHDWETLRDCFHPDGVTHDHRTLGLGELTAQRWIESLRAYQELSSDVRVEPFRILAWDAHGRVSLVRVQGTRDGGAFENLFVALAALRGERIARYEFFDPGDAERALARFEELRAGSS